MTFFLFRQNPQIFVRPHLWQPPRTERVTKLWPLMLLAGLLAPPGMCTADLGASPETPIFSPFIVVADYDDEEDEDDYEDDDDTPSYVGPSRHHPAPVARPANSREARTKPAVRPSYHRHTATKTRPSASRRAVRHRPSAHRGHVQHRAAHRRSGKTHNRYHAVNRPSAKGSHSQHRPRSRSTDRHNHRGSAKWTRTSHTHVKYRRSAARHRTKRQGVTQHRSHSPHHVRHPTNRRGHAIHARHSPVTKRPHHSRTSSARLRGSQHASSSGRTFKHRNQHLRPQSKAYRKPPSRVASRRSRKRHRGR